MPVDLAVRISTSLPVFHKMMRYNGHEYIDGGCVNNFPIDKGSEQRSSEFESRYIKQTRLGVRVEYDDEMDTLWRPAKHENFVMRWFNNVKRAIFIKLSGYDVVKSEEDTINLVKNDYAHRTIQLFDQGIGLTDFAMDTAKKSLLDSTGKAATKQFFANVQDERLKIVNVTQLDKLKKHPAVLKKLLDALRQKKITFSPPQSHHPEEARIKLLGEVEGLCREAGVVVPLPARQVVNGSSSAVVAHAMASVVVSAPAVLEATVAQMAPSAPPAADVIQLHEGDGERESAGEHLRTKVK